MKESQIHNISSQSSNNQFMMGQSSMFSGEIKNSQFQMEKMFAYMKNIVSNPLLMEQMEKHLASKQIQNKSSFIVQQNQNLSISRLQNENMSEPRNYVVYPAQQKIPQTFKDQTSNNNFKKSNIHKKGRDVIENYNSRQSKISQQQQQIHQKQQQIFIKNAKASFDDIPIKSNYIENFQSNDFSNMPGAYPNQQSYAKKKISNNKKQVIEVHKSNQNKFTEFQERPINGSKKDFKQLLKEKFQQTPFDKYIKHDEVPIGTKKSTYDNQVENQEYQNQNQDQNDEAKPKRQFLKRGSRQYLSSAKDKVNVKKHKHDNNLNNSRLGADKDERDKTPTKREVSQNRILSKRNTVNANDKSVSKIKQTKTQNDSQNDSFYQSEANLQRSITPKNQKVNNQRDKSPALPPKFNKTIKNTVNHNQSLHSQKANQGRKKDTKNVFNDSSSEQSDQQNQAVNKKSNNLRKEQRDKKNNYEPEKQYNMFSRQKKNQVIQGVFLTKSQLDLILQKYTSIDRVNQQNSIKNKNEEKFIELRKKYTDLCNLLEKQKIQHQEQMIRQKQEFQIYKTNEIQKLKNQKRVMQRQMKSTMPSQSHNIQKDREQVENLKKQIQKERDQHKKKDKNNKILIEKFKKENQELKLKIDKFEVDIQILEARQKNNFSNVKTSDKNSTLHNTRGMGNILEKSQSKLGQAKDVSPLKNRTVKSTNRTQENQQEDQQNKNYKKTVPIRAPQQNKHMNKNSSISIKKDKGVKQNQRNGSDEEYLPKFKLGQNKLETKQTRKKYQYVENQSQQNSSYRIKNNQKINNSHFPTKNIGNGKKKNVFSNKFDSESSENQEENQEQTYENEDKNDFHHQEGFFKYTAKFEKLSDLMQEKFSIKQVTPKIIEKLFRYENNDEYMKYIEKKNNPKRVIVNSSKNGVDKTITNTFNDKSKQMLFEKGVKKQIFENGYTIIYFKNGDIKQKLSDGTILYYFKEKHVDQITLTNGINIYRFDNNQVEIHYNGGKYIQIRNPDGTIKVLGSPIH